MDSFGLLSEPVFRDTKLAQLLMGLKKAIEDLQSEKRYYSPTRRQIENLWSPKNFSADILLFFCQATAVEHKINKLAEHFI